MKLHLRPCTVKPSDITTANNALVKFSYYFASTPSAVFLELN